jgi:methylmalonyl-CoA mutase
MENLFSEFNIPTANDWKNQIIKDLKGEAYDQLIWKNENGFEVKPFYTKEDINYTPEPVFTHTDWEITSKATGQTFEEKNQSLLHSLKSGATAIELDEYTDYYEVLKEIELNYIHATFFVEENSLIELTDYLKSNYTLEELSINLFCKSLSTEHDLSKWYAAIKEFTSLKNIKCISINALPHHNQNCNAQYEVALIFSELVEHLEFQRKNNIKVLSAPVIKTGVNCDYFVQIAKLRAIRKIWTIIRDEYKLGTDIYIIAETTLTNKSISDNYNNLLRTSIESMAAVAGGANEVLVNGFDVLLKTNTLLSKRMSLNQQLILKHESYLDKMADIGCGSYYIESLTDSIAESSLSTFKKFEEQGGYFACLNTGVFTKEIKLQAEEKQKHLDNFTNLSIGVNKYKNANERFELSRAQIDSLKNLKVNNPVLHYELIHFLNK